MSTTDQNNGSIESVASMLIEQPNQSEAVEAEVAASDDDQTDIEEYIAESDDAVDHDDSDYEVEASDDDDDVEMDDYTDEAAVPVELSDDVEIELKSDGQLKKATLKELKQAYAGQDYIQKGMEQNAQIRKELEQAAQQFQQDQKAFYDRLQQYETNGYPTPPQKPAKELQDSDPLGYLEQMEAYREGMAEYQNLMQERQQMEQQQSAAEQQAQQQYLLQQAEVIKQRIPEFNDPNKGKQLLTDIQDTAVNYYGMPAELINNLSHSWEIEILRDAMMYRQIKGNTDKAKEKTKGARPVAKAGAKRTEDPRGRKQQRSKARMQKTGDVKDVASFLLS